MNLDASTRRLERYRGSPDMKKPTRWSGLSAWIHGGRGRNHTRSFRTTTRPKKWAKNAWKTPIFPHSL